MTNASEKIVEGLAREAVATFQSHEASLWALSAVSVTFVGLFARYLDDKEEKASGKLRLRFTNLFCATFCCAVSVLYYSIIVVQAGGGTARGFFDVLVGNVTLSPLEEFQASVMHALMLAYMAQDLVGRVIWKNWRLPFVVHHVACIVGLANSMFFGQSGMFGAAVGLSEFSTPLVAVIDIARADGLNRFVMVAGAVLFFVFPARVCLFTYFNYLWLVEHTESPAFGTEHGKYPHVVGVTSMVCICILTVLNWVWWGNLLQACYNAFVKTNSTLPEAAYANRNAKKAQKAE